MICFGSSGFSYNDWVGNFYPVSMPKRKWLSYNAREFNTCELNSTFCAAGKPGSILRELSEWLPKIQKLDNVAEETFILTNNHWRGQAVSTIRQLRVMLD